MTEFRTPVNDRRAAAAKKMKDSFPGRLDWKLRHYGVPVTSTPKPEHSGVPTNRDKEIDIKTCFGFDESEEENYSALISPIVSTSKAFSKNGDKQSKDKKLEENQVLQENNSKMSPIMEGKKSTQKVVSSEDLVETKEKEVPVENTKKSKTTKGKGTLRKQPTRKIKPAATKTTDRKGKDPPQLFDVDSFAISQRLECNISKINDLPSNDESYNRFFVKQTGDGDGFNALLARYGQVDEESDNELHINAGKIKKTYSSISRKRSSIQIQQSIPSIPKITKKTKPKQSTKSKAKNTKSAEKEYDADNSDSDLDPETKKWITEKNKEFDDVLHVPLMMTSNTNTKSIGTRKSSRVSRARKVNS